MVHQHVKCCLADWHFSTLSSLREGPTFCHALLTCQGNIPRKCLNFLTLLGSLSTSMLVLFLYLGLYLHLVNIQPRYWVCKYRDMTLQRLFSGLHCASSWGPFSFARWSSRIPLVMTVGSSAYACTYFRASLGSLFLIKILEDVYWTVPSCGIPRENNGTHPNRYWVLLMV